MAASKIARLYADCIHCLIKFIYLWVSALVWEPKDVKVEAKSPKLVIPRLYNKKISD